MTVSLIKYLKFFLVILSMFIDFAFFFAIFMDFRGRGLGTGCGVCKQSPAPQEPLFDSFAISDFHGFRGSNVGKEMRRLQVSLIKQLIRGSFVN